MTDVEFHNIDVLCIQETHDVEEIYEKVISVRNRKYHYINLGCQNRFYGLGFIVRSGALNEQFFKAYLILLIYSRNKF